MVGGLIQALIALNNESYVPQRWHQTLLTIAVISSSIIFNTVLAVRLPLIEGLYSKLRMDGPGHLLTLDLHLFRHRPDPSCLRRLCHYNPSLGHGAPSARRRCAARLHEHGRMGYTRPCSTDRHGDTAKRPHRI